MAGTDSTRYQLDPEDAQRMRRLTEEVRGRLLEMAMITARTAGVELRGSAAIRFVPHKAAADAEADPGDWMEIDEVDGVEVCYGVIGGQAFAESPCGAH